MKTVGIVGCQPRIGTTTQALQLTLCLMHMGYNVAYVEMGERDYIEKLDALYQGITIDKKYSLQGTTQSRYLTGGVPPVRFSM